MTRSASDLLEGLNITVVAQIEQLVSDDESSYTMTVAFDNPIPDTHHRLAREANRVPGFPKMFDGRHAWISGTFDEVRGIIDEWVGDANKRYPNLTVVDA